MERSAGRAVPLRAGGVQLEIIGEAVTVAEETSGRLTEKEVDIAESRLEVDKTVALIRALATQQRLALQACYSVLIKGEKRGLKIRCQYNSLCWRSSFMNFIIYGCNQTHGSRLDKGCNINLL